MCLSSHINELTEDIEQLKSSLLDNTAQKIKACVLSKKCSNSCTVEMNRLSKENSKGFAVGITQFQKQQEKYTKMKAKLKEYQSNNTVYLNEIKGLKEKLEKANKELINIKTEFSNSSMDKSKLGELEDCLNDSKNLIISMKDKCTKLKQEKKELHQKLKEEAVTINYIKTSIY